MGLLDQVHSFAQGASNGVAGSLTGPVDGLAWLLRKAGVPMPDAPMGGSDWMRNVGLMQEPKERMAGLLGEGIGSALPTVIAGKAPQIAGGLLQMERNAMAPRTLDPQAGAVLWHGSPHKFSKFDSSKIGTGEGAQAYGHGLYLAESPDVAKSYSGKLASELAYNGVQMNRDSARASKDAAAWALYLANGDKATAKASGLASDKWIDKLDPAKLQPGGSLYKVDLPDEAIAKMLDWDKPLSQQAPEVQAAVKPLLSDIFDVRQYGGGWGSLEPDANAVRDVFTKSGHSLGTYSAQDANALNFSGSDIVKALGGMDKESSATAKTLRDAGIPGIKYLDGGSRGAGAGTSNFVVFPGNEGLLKILERNGQGLLGN